MIMTKHYVNPKLGDVVFYNDDDTTSCGMIKAVEHYNINEPLNFDKVTCFTIANPSTTSIVDISKIIQVIWHNPNKPKSTNIYEHYPYAHNGLFIGDIIHTISNMNITVTRPISSKKAIDLFIKSGYGAKLYHPIKTCIRDNQLTEVSMDHLYSCRVTNIKMFKRWISRNIDKICYTRKEINQRQLDYYNLVLETYGVKIDRKDLAGYKGAWEWVEDE